MPVIGLPVHAVAAGAAQPKGLALGQERVVERESHLSEPALRNYGTLRQEMIEFSAPVRDALDRQTPVVALESTILAHGLPYPDNLAVGKALERAVVDQGAVPATIAVIDGVARIGLTSAQLELVASPESTVFKAGAADLAAVIASGATAATTVSGTCVLAHRAGIRLFATGGIGGVHRGDPADVSSDLSTLARTPIAVVSAGAKAILDLRRTVEALETAGVLVVGYGTGQFPAFYCRWSGLELEHQVDSEQQMASILRARFALDLGGVLIANPIAPAAEIAPERVQAWIEQAENEANQQQISGKSLTPYLLARLAQISGGATIAANRQLVVDNARLAARIAVALANDA